MAGANKRTFEVDRFLTRELLLKNPDNTIPSSNQVIFTDGKGGTYLGPLNPLIPTTGFNQITLTDTNSTFLANMPYNTLNVKQGTGVTISKQTINSQDLLVFAVTALVPSSFFLVSTHDGVVSATSQSSILNIISYDSVDVRASSNSLYISGTPAFGIINLSTSAGRYSLIPSTSLSSVTIQEGFGIILKQTGSTSYSISNKFSTLALNAIGLPGIVGSPLTFLDLYNQIYLSSSGTLQLAIKSTMIVFSNYAFSNIQLPNGQRIEASTANNSLVVLPGYGLTYSTILSSYVSTAVSSYASTISSNITIITSTVSFLSSYSTLLSINTSLPSSFSIISTPRGTIAATNSTNILTIQSGYGIDYVVNSQTLTIKLSTNMVAKISTEAGVISANTQSLVNLRQGKSIIYSTSSDNMLYINSKDYNRIDIIDGASNVIVNSIFASLNQKTVGFIQGAGLSIVGNSQNNTILFQPISTISYVSGPSYAFSYLQVFSTAAYFGQDITNFEYNTINSAPVSQAVFKIVGVFPLQMTTNITSSIVYMGLDQSTMLSSINLELSSLSSIMSTFSMNPLTLSMTASSILSQVVQTNTVNTSSITVGGSLIATYTPTLSSLIIASEISSIYTETKILNLSTINNSVLSTPLVIFDYTNNRIAINTGATQPQATLHVGGVVLAQNFATYSDSSLKNFNKRYEVSQDDLETLKPWNFTWKDNDMADIGFAAEDVERVLPSAVKISPTGLRMVDYSRLSVISLAALRDTNRRLNSLESTVNSLLMSSAEVNKI